MGLTEFYWVLHWSIRRNRRRVFLFFLLNFYEISLVFIGFYWVLPSFTWLLLDLTGFHLVFVEFYMDPLTKHRPTSNRIHSIETRCNTSKKPKPMGNHRKWLNKILNVEWKSVEQEWWNRWDPSHPLNANCIVKTTKFNIFNACTSSFLSIMPCGSFEPHWHQHPPLLPWAELKTRSWRFFQRQNQQITMTSLLGQRLQLSGTIFRSFTGTFLDL